MKMIRSVKWVLVLSAATAPAGCDSKQNTAATAPAPVATAPAPVKEAARPAADEIDPKVLKRFLPIGVAESPAPRGSARPETGRPQNRER